MIDDKEQTMAVIKPKTVTLKNGKKACIRTGIKDDSQTLLDCMGAIFQDDRFFGTTQAESKERLTLKKMQERTLKSLQNENQLLLITETDGQALSMAEISCSENKRLEHVGQIGISIMPQYRRLGLGTAIMETMIEWAAAHPVIEKLALGVWAANEPAIALYEKMGFIEEGRKVREVKYANGSYDDCVCMYRFIK